MKLLLPIFLLTFLIFTTQKSQATHVIGGDIEWTDLGNDKYAIQVNVFADCNGRSFANTATDLSGKCAGITMSSQTVIGPIDITPVCKSTQTRCDSSTSSFSYGVAQYTLTQVLDVSQFKKNGCCELDIYWTECCRSGAITTGAANQQFHIEANINLCQKLPNNSPKFNYNPTSVICLGRDYVNNLGAFDYDTNVAGHFTDSLVFSITRSKQKHATYTSWKSPNSHDKPLSYLGFPKDYNSDRFPFGFHFDSLTGDMMFRPMKLETTIINIQVEQYRNGIKIGQTQRESVVFVIKCPNNVPPVISGMNCAKAIPEAFESSVCPGEKICFKVCATDKDTLDSLTMSFKSEIKGASISINNSDFNSPFLDFCWTPTLADISNNPHLLRLSVKDNACPNYGLASRTFKIYVRQKPVVKYKIDDLGCGQVRLSAKESNQLAIKYYQWLIDSDTLLKNSGSSDTTLYSFKKGGTKQIALDVNNHGCKVNFKDSITLKPFLNQEISKDTSVCENATVSLKTTVYNAQGPTSIEWKISDTLNSTQNAISFLGIKTGYAIMSITDQTCVIKDSVLVTVLPRYLMVDVGTDTSICASDKLYLKATPSNGIWTGNNITQQGASYYFSTNKPTSNGEVLLYSLADSNGCKYADSLKIQVNKSPLIDAGPNDTICINNSTKYYFKSNPKIGHWYGPGTVWSGANAHAEVTFNSRRINQYTFSISDSNGCESSDSMLLYVGDKTISQFTPSTRNGGVNQKIDFVNTSAGSFKWLWTFGDGNNSNQFEGPHTYRNTGSYIVSLLAVDKTGFCSSTAYDTINVGHPVGSSITLSNSFSVFPNPVNSVLFIDNTSNSAGTFRLLDLTGKLVLEEEIIGTETVDVNRLPPGSYFYHFIHNDQSTSGKIVIE